MAGDFPKHKRPGRSGNLKRVMEIKEHHTEEHRAAAGDDSPAEAPLPPSAVLGVPPGAEAEAADDGSPAVDAYYDAARKEYLIKNSGGRWLAHKEAAFRRILIYRGFSASKRDGEILTECEEEMLRVQDTRDVSFCGPLAGRAAGFYEELGTRFLVTESPRLVEPKPGEFPVIRAILRGLLAGEDEPHGARQLQLALGWLASAARNLYGGTRQAGQALVLAGPAGCGKSVFQNHVITPALGGRSAKCVLFLQGRTAFNSELFGAEHLMLEDENADTSIAARLGLAASIKQICVNEVQPCHAKHRPIVNLRPFWRLSVSVNDEPERLTIIPPLARDIADKIIILRCGRVRWPMPADTREGWARLRAAMDAELPAFIHYLLEAHEIPGELRSDRYGVAHWHHPELAEALESLSPEAHFAQLLLRWLPPRDHWTGTADQLRTELTGHDDTARDARDLLRWMNACGTYLGRLAQRGHPLLEIQQRRTAFSREWVIRLTGDPSAI